MLHTVTALLLFGATITESVAEWEISSGELLRYKIPRTTVFKTAKGQSMSCPGSFLILSANSNDGAIRTGLGDILPRANVTNETKKDSWNGAKVLARMLIGTRFDGNNLEEDRQTLHRVMENLKSAANDFDLTTKKPPAKHRQLRATLCGFDTALLALVGDIYGISIAEVLGEQVRDEVKISGVTKSLGISPAGVQKSVVDAHEQHRCIRLKTGVDRESELAMLRAAALAIRGHRPELELFVDVNQGWKDAPTAIEALLEIREVLLDSGFTGRFICEQPTHESSFEDIAQVTKVTRQWAKEDPFQILIMADESVWDTKDLEELVALDAVDQINIKIQKAGGLTESLRMAEYLNHKKPDWEIYIGGLLMTDVGARANLQLGYVLPRLDYMTGAVPRRTNKVNPATEPLRYFSGTRILIPSEEPGLGTGLDREILKPFIEETYYISKDNYESKS